MPPIRSFILHLLLLLVVAGCTGVSEKGAPSLETHLGQAQEAVASGDHYLAYRLYSQLAKRSAQPEASGYALEAAEQQILAGQPQQARPRLEQLELQYLNGEQQLRRQLLLAELWLKSDPQETLRQLELPAISLASAPATTAAKFFLLRAQAHSRLGDPLAAAREYIQRGAYLDTEAERLDNQLTLWHSLSRLSQRELEQIPLPAPPDVLGGWLELTMLAKRYHLTPTEVGEQLALWRQRHPNHPALPEFITSLQQRSDELARRPERIALLLPLSGKFAHAADALRDGILTSFYQDPAGANISLHLYDTAADPQQVEQRYREAVNEGAQFVIGPLEREAVRQLAKLESLPVPVLALNYAEESASDNFYQFNLSPEDEAIEVAERAWAAGYANAAMLTPKSPLGERLAAAFNQRWWELGGTVVSKSSYDPSRNDFSASIKGMLGIDLSEQRRRDIRYLAGDRVEYTPRRRQDIDFIFLAAFPRQARLIRPQLRFHHAGDLPLLATSHVYSGSHDNRSLDRDMDGISFGDMPWILDPQARARIDAQSREQLAAQHPGQMQRLVAMGIDAYQLIPLLPLLDRSQYERYQGQTGTLFVGRDHRIKRHMLWARMEKGIARLEKNGEMGE